MAAFIQRVTQLCLKAMPIFDMLRHSIQQDVMAGAKSASVLLILLRYTMHCSAARIAFYALSLVASTDAVEAVTCDSPGNAFRAATVGRQLQEQNPSSLMARHGKAFLHQVFMAGHCIPQGSYDLTHL